MLFTKDETQHTPSPNSTHPALAKAYPLIWGIFGSLAKGVHVPAK